LSNVPGNEAETIAFNLVAAITLGDVQGKRLSIADFFKVECDLDSGRCYEVNLLLEIYNIFGAGEEDRNKGGYVWGPLQTPHRFPGLAEMWILQHCRYNNSLGYTFIPFIHTIKMGHKFKICIQ